MRSGILFGAVALAASAWAIPTPQDIDFDLAEALPNPTYTTTLSQVTYDATAILESALPQITASATDDADAANVKVKRTACAPQPTGAGPIPSPDSASAFLNLAAFSSAAVNAPTPSGYSQTFSNLNASNNAYGYMGYTTLQSYDVNSCAAKCNAINGCMAINIYYERDPSVDPGSGSSGCANPASTTNIKCVFWGGVVNSANALNAGQYRNQFQVVIAGSNGYVNSSIATPAGYTAATDLGNAAINAPYDVYGFDSYMGSAIFTSGPFNASLCATACSQKSAYNLAHPPTDGSPIQTCQFFNTYVLYINNTNHLQGQYCAMYSESWSSKYATNVGQYRGSDHYLIEMSYSFSNASNSGSATPVAAVYQAKKDILWPANSAQPYCSSLLGYTVPVVTSSTTTTAPTVLSTTTLVVTATTEVFVKRTAEPAILRAPATTATVAARQALSQPSVLSKYPASIVSSACVLAVSSPATSTFTALTTITPTSTVTSTTTTTTTSTSSTPQPASATTGSVILQAVGGPYDGQYAVVADPGDGLNDKVINSFTASVSAATTLLLDSAGHLSLNGYYANVNDPNGLYLLYFNTASAISASGYHYLPCSIAADGTLSISPESWGYVSDLGQFGGAGIVVEPNGYSGGVEVTPMSFKAIVQSS